MASDRFDCPRCGAEVAVDDAMQSVACEGCATWFHAARCERCDHRYVAMGVGSQVCPSCGARQRLEASQMDNFGGVPRPLWGAMSQIPIRRVPTVAVGGAAPLDGGWSANSPYATVLSTVLGLGAGLTLLGGLVAAAISAKVLADAHAGAGTVALDLFGTLLGTVVAAATLAALAYLVEHVDALERAFTARTAVGALPPAGSLDPPIAGSQEFG